MKIQIRQILNKYNFKDKNTKIYIIVIAVLVLFALLFSFIKFKHSKNDYISKNSDYSSSFYHYTNFENTKQGSIKLGWKKNKIRLSNGKAYSKMLVRVSPSSLNTKDITYKSSNEDIAKIDSNGNITATAPGTVQIYATLKKTGQTEVAELDVIEPVTGIILEKTDVVINVTDPWRQLKTEISPDNATIRDLIWSSSNPKVAVVDENGTLKPVGVGDAQITVKTKDGGFESKCFVRVINKTVDVSNVSIQNKGSEKLAVGEKMNMVATVLPTNAANKIVTWESSNPNVAKISKVGKITALSEGSTKITVTSANGKSDTMTLTVAASDSKNILDLTDQVTSQNIVSTSILGSSYINGLSSNFGGTLFTSYDITLDDIVDIQMKTSPPPKIWKSGGTVYATRNETKEYMNPASYYAGAYKYQFLDLSSSNNVSADELNTFLADKGILAGQGQAFVDASNELNISEVYLVAHACLETGNGTSTLSKGVEVNGQKVYNMYGIGAYDNSALASGSKRAYDYGWTSPESAIKGGAKWISEHYINASPRQNTLYKMLWNPEMPGYHQYATDIGWAIKQASNIEKIFASFPNAVLAYDIPVYSGETAINLE